MNGRRYEKYAGRETEVILDGRMEEAIEIIAQKAFLSCKSIEKLVLPDTLEAVENWGFAHMKNLREIVFPVKDIRFGKQVFLGCGSLEKVSLRPSVCWEGIPFFLASMFRFFPQERLEDVALAGSPDGQWRWLSDYDCGLEIFLNGPDDNGFEPAFIGWFDVEDVDDQRSRYIVERRGDKVRLVFQRLFYGERLTERLRQRLEEFLRSHFEAVRSLFCEREEPLARDIRYYKIWRQSGGLSREAAEELLQVVPAEEPEIRAYLMGLQTEAGRGDFFAGLRL